MIETPPFDVAQAATAAPAVPNHPLLSSRFVSQELWRWHEEYVLGTRLDIIAHTDDQAAANRAKRAIREEIARLDAVLSGYREDSELSALNRSTRAVVSPDLFAVLERAEYWRAQTGGAFDGRLGAALEAWRTGTGPSGFSAATLGAPVLVPETRAVTRPDGVIFALDGIAKGYVLDRALAAGRAAAPSLAGLLIGIGGDIVAYGHAPGGRAWQAGIDDVLRYGVSAPMTGIVRLNGAALATSGRGPRDFIVGGVRASATLAAPAGAPAAFNIAASVRATCAADADALSTALLAAPAKNGLARIAALPHVAARIVDAGGVEHYSPNWFHYAQAAGTPATPSAAAIPEAMRWPGDWALFIDYVTTGPSYFMAIWISDPVTNRPIRTVALIGKDAEWQRENFIWWGAYKENAKRMVDLRSQPTSISGFYPVYWEGLNDAYRPVPIGDYMLHIETNREHGAHQIVSIPIKIGKERFNSSPPPGREGRVSLRFRHFNERFSER